VESSGGIESTLANWRSALEDANEELSLGVAKLAVGAMSSTDSLDEVDEELVKRRKSLRGSESGGSESAG
jgi:hypothetical protein